ncbi:hypothetical protein [Pontibacter sp. H249]|uniref:hypothetical protein n=1 Tax=Pontibacter sp. H249 TaxID=3133420 RepID=UPI0030C50032
MKHKTVDKSKSKKWLITGSIIVGITILLFTGLYVFNFWLENKIESSVHKQSKGVYTLKLHGLETSPFVGLVSVDSLSLTPDYKRWEQLREQQQEVSRTLLDLKSKSISLNSLNFFNMLFRNNVTLESLVVQQPSMVMTVMMQDTTTTHKPMHETVKGLLRSMKVGKIDVDSATFKYKTRIGNDAELLHLKSFNLTVQDFQLDSASFNDDSRAYYAKRILVKAAGAEATVPEGHYHFTTDSLIVDTANNFLTAKKINMQPKTKNSDVARAKGRAVTSINLKISDVSVTGVDYAKHSRKNDVYIQHILINEPNLDAYKDKHNFKDKGVKPLPHDLVQQVKFKLNVDTVQVKNAYMRYEELSQGATETGHIFFSRLNGTVTNLTNIPSKISKSKPAVVSARALLMGKTEFQATARLPLLDKNAFHTLEGSLGSGNPEMLNPILVPTNFIKVDEGYVRQITFNATLNRNGAKGSMKALYSNLEIEVLSKGATSEEDQSLGKEIISQAANWFLIKSSNPDDKGEKPRIGEINVTRNKQGSFITYWKDCIVSGLMASIGLEKMADNKFN